ncbi:MAG: queuosine precursor transporter [Anaerolineales bacterium]
MTREQSPPLTQGAVARSTILVVSAYVAAQMMADVGSLKIARVGGFSVDGGTFIYPITFTLRDMVHKLLGRKAARTVIVVAAFINLLMAAYFALVSALPLDPESTLALFEILPVETGSSVPPDAFALVLSPVWRIVMASIVAEILSELLDTEVYHLWVTRITRRYEWARVLVSNGVSIPVDSLVFSWAAFGGVLPSAVVWSIFWFNVLVKGLTTLASLPGIYLVKERSTPREE